MPTVMPPNDHKPIVLMADLIPQSSVGASRHRDASHRRGPGSRPPEQQTGCRAPTDSGNDDRLTRSISLSAVPSHRTQESRTRLIGLSTASLPDMPGLPHFSWHVCGAGPLDVPLTDRPPLDDQTQRPCGLRSDPSLVSDDVREAREAARGTPYLSSKEAARYLGFNYRSLQNMRSRGTGPRFFRIGRQIRYHIRDLVAYARDGDPRGGGNA